MSSLFLKKFFKIDLKIYFKLKSINNMLSTEDLKELEKNFMNAKSQDVIRGMILVVGAIIIVFSLFY
jgi:hypothetical protein